MSSKAAAPVLSVSLLITGNMVGAGILGLPINTGLAGFGPSLAAMLFYWLLMMGTAFVLADLTIKSDEIDFDLPSLFAQNLGRGGRWLAVAANLLILYGLAVAYLCGGTNIMVGAFGLPKLSWLIGLLFFTVLAGLIVFGGVVVRKSNLTLMIVMWAAFIGLIGYVLPLSSLERFAFADLGLLPSAMPIMVTAFVFHNIVPTACRALNRDRAMIYKALVTGSLVGLIMNLAWVAAVLGALPVSDQSHNNILYAMDHGQPATVPLAALLGSPAFSILAAVFALTAITTSFLASGTALLSFSRNMSADMLNIRNRSWHIAVAFLPPLAVALFYPDLFLSALNLVGGVGVALLFGVLPGYLLYKRSGSKTARLVGAALICCFLGVLCFEIAQEVGWMRIDPHTELWNAGLRLFPEHYQGVEKHPDKRAMDGPPNWAT